MSPAAFVTRIRDHYVDQFRAFANQQRASCTVGAAEVKLQQSEQSGLLNRLYCADFIKNDGAQEVVELQPENFLAFEPIAGTFGKASLSIEYLRWDDVLIRHNLDEVPPEPLSQWFQLWFDPDDVRHDPTAELSDVIHSALLQANCVSIDFGSADPNAFWDILQLLEEAGATSLEVSSSRAEAPTSINGFTTWSGRRHAGGPPVCHAELDDFRTSHVLRLVEYIVYQIITSKITE